jgi:HK97 family phage major capsid protein
MHSTEVLPALSGLPAGRHVPRSVISLLALGSTFLSGIFAHTDGVIVAHRERQDKLLESSQAILAKAEAESREINEDERKELKGLNNEWERLEDEIAERDRVVAMADRMAQSRGRQTDPDPIPGDEPAQGRPAASASRPPAISTARAQQNAPRATAYGTGGFRGLGDFALSVRAACIHRGAELDPRLRNAATTYGSEGVGADGGFAVPPDFRSEIMVKVFGEDSLINRTDRIQSSSNTLTIPTDMTTPWDSSGGIQSYWTAEGATKTQSKPKLEDVTLKLHTLATLVPVTEELLEDAPAMDSYLRRKVPEKMDFKISDAIVRGTGAGQPLGFLNSPALVTVSAEGGQTADTINATNVLKMLARLPVQSRRNAVWLVHPDAEVQLPLMTIGNSPAYQAPGGLAQNPYGVLLGRPVIPHQVAETVGDLGDLMLVDLSQYLSVTKTGGGRDANGMRTDVSIHLWFDQDMVAYRFTIRVAGQPWWSSTTAQRDGSNVQSPFVVLAAR